VTVTPEAVASRETLLEQHHQCKRLRHLQALGSFKVPHLVSSSLLCCVPGYCVLRTTPCTRICGRTSYAFAPCVKFIKVILNSKSVSSQLAVHLSWLLSEDLLGIPCILSTKSLTKIKKQMLPDPGQQLAGSHWFYPPGLTERH